MTDPRHGRLSIEAEAARVRREGSGQSASRQHEAKRCPGFCSAAVPDPQSVQAAPGNRGNRRLGFPAVGDDPGHDRREVSSLGEDRGALDHLAAGGVRTRQPRDQSANRVVVHFSHHSLSRGRASDSSPSGIGEVDEWDEQSRPPLGKGAELDVLARYDKYLAPCMGAGTATDSERRWHACY